VTRLRMRQLLVVITAVLTTAACTVSFHAGDGAGSPSAGSVPPLARDNQAVLDLRSLPTREVSAWPWVRTRAGRRARPATPTRRHRPAIPARAGTALPNSRSAGPPARPIPDQHRWRAGATVGSGWHSRDRPTGRGTCGSCGLVSGQLQRCGDVLGPAPGKCVLRCGDREAHQGLARSEQLPLVQMRLDTGATGQLDWEGRLLADRTDGPGRRRDLLVGHDLVGLLCQDLEGLQDGGREITRVRRLLRRSCTPVPRATARSANGR